MNLFRRISFNLWYLCHPPWDSGISPPELLDFIHSHPPSRALDLGCGSGTNVVTLARAGWQVTGVDFAPRAIAIARRKVEAAGLQVDLRVDDVTRLKTVNERFDLAVDLGCFHSLDQSGKSNYLDRLDQILVPSGFWLLYAFFKPDARPGPGLLETDLELAARHLRLVRRKDGFDKRNRPSAWFVFQAS